MKQITRKVVSAIFYGFAFFIMIFGIAFGNLFRDGLGPDAVESHGILALYRTLQGSWVFILLGLIIAYMAYRINKNPLNKTLE